MGAGTGRFSSKEPNLQNVTRGPLRSCFIPSGPDRRLIVADYSQIELRAAALIANDPVMIKAFREGVDLHKQIAAINLNKNFEDVIKEERDKVGKPSNFGFLYGQSAEGLVPYAKAQWDSDLTLEEAARFRENFFETYPDIRRWHDECREKANNLSITSARTVFGRLLLPDNETWWRRFNMFTNYVVQGSCADLIKAAMLKVSSVLPQDVRLIATVHDELVFDAPADMANHYCSVIRQAMTDAFIEMFGPEIARGVVEVKVCATWADK